jgi:hypothetical protein
MPQLNIGGQTINVDDSFTTLSPDQQNAAVDHIASQLGQIKPAMQAKTQPRLLSDADVGIPAQPRLLGC